MDGSRHHPRPPARIIRKGGASVYLGPGASFTGFSRQRAEPPNGLAVGAGTALTVNGVTLEDEDKIGLSLSVFGDHTSSVRSLYYDNRHTVGKWCDLRDSVVSEQVVLGRSVVLRHCVIGAGCVVGNGAVLEGVRVPFHTAIPSHFRVNACLFGAPGGHGPNWRLYNPVLTRLIGAGTAGVISVHIALLTPAWDDESEIKSSDIVFSVCHSFPPNSFGSIFYRFCAEDGRLDRDNVLASLIGSCPDSLDRTVRSAILAALNDVFGHEAGEFDISDWPMIWSGG